MKVYVNRKPVAGPWGGGSKVLSAVIKSLSQAGHELVYDFVPGIDVIFCMDPRPGSEKGQYGYKEIYQYVHSTSVSRPKVIQRVGDVGSHGKPDLTNLAMLAAYHSDVVVFPSLWAHDFIQHSLAVFDKRPNGQWHIVPNAPMSVFYKHRCIRESLPTNISFVTHHWSTNQLKGFDCYRSLESHLRELGHEFTFYGRQPEGLQLMNVKGPLTEIQLSEELPKHHVYITASLAEAGANHVLEAIASGLPVIYHQDGGSINEYCAPYGVSFDGSIDSFMRALDVVKMTICQLSQNIEKYKLTVDDQAMKYVKIIENL